MTVCPDREQLVQFLDGRVAPPVAEAVSRHVDGCTACLAALETLTDDSQFRPAGGIRRADTGPSPAFLDRLKAASPGAAAARPVRPPTIPGYEIEEELGRGGAGVVYKARHAALDRTVALKVMLGGGHVGADELARFRAEALAVGRLAHSGIVRVYEVGEWTPAGGGPPLPYASLEYVSGGSWDRELGRTPQPPRAAAERLAGLAAAAHAAHREGIIHRDIKPANVLIDAATGAAKIADFGLAKQLRLDSGRTQTGVILGTPSYMSPEQARGDRAVDARTDVYGLGAVLYEVLTGRPPFLGPTPLDTIVQVAEVDPIAPRQLQPTIPRDLETICLKCLEKAPARRYPSAAALADDLDRFLAGRPIIAHPVGPVGRAVKLARRHPVVVSLAAALVVVIVGSLAGLTTLYAQAVRDRADADSARQKAQDEAAAAGAERAKALAAKEEAEAATGRAKKAAAGVQAVSGFFQKNVLAAPRPKGTGAGIDVTLRQAIDDAEGKIRDQFRDQPEIEAAVRDTLVSTYYLRGQYDKAAAQAERVLALRRGFLTPDDPEVFSAQNNLALSYLQLGRFPEAETMLRDTLAGRERVLGPDAPQTLASMNSLAGYLLFSGQSRAAADLLRRALAAHARVSPADSPDVLSVKGNLGAALNQVGRPAEAEPLVREVLRVREAKLPPTHQDVILSRGVLCDLLRRTGRLDEAERLAGEVTRATDATFGPNSPQAVKAGITALLIRGERGDLDGVVSGVRSLLARAAGTTPPDHPERLIAITDAAVYLIDHARAADAGPWVDEVVAARRALPGGDNLLLATALLLQADCRLAAGRPGDAEIAAREALAIREKRLPPTHWGRHVAASTLGGCLAGRGRFADAEPLLTQSYQALRENADVPFLRAREAHARVLKMYTDWGRPSEAAKWGDPPLER